MPESNQETPKSFSESKIMGWKHVYPVNDLKEHQLGNWMMWNESGTEQHPYCDCNPEIDWEHRICIHNAWDMREAQEYINNN